LQLVYQGSIHIFYALSYVRLISNRGVHLAATSIIRNTYVLGCSMSSGTRKGKLLAIRNHSDRDVR